MRRRLLAVAVAAVAAAVLTGCSDIHPGQAVVIDNGDYEASISKVDDLTGALCVASPILAQSQGQQGQQSESIEARQYVVGLLIQSYLTPLAAKQAGADSPSPQDLTVTPEDYTNITDKMDDAQADDFLQLLQIGTEVSAWQSQIGLTQPNSSPSTAAQDGQKYVLDYAKNFDIDIDPRFGMNGNDLGSGKLQRSGSISVAQSSQATQRENPDKKAAVLESLPKSQICG